MQPSSLIFLVIIGIWAAYFVQYWVRRREHLATIRSVDAFSRTMRVLERRDPLPSVDHGAQAPRTYAVSPARAVRPQVTVKRAEARAPVPSTTSSTGVSIHRPVRAERPAPAARVEPVAAEPTMQPGRATRGMVVLVGLLGTVVFGVLSLVGVLVPWAVVVPLTMAGAGFVWLRSGVQAELRARRAARGRARRAAEGRVDREPVGASVASTRVSATPAARTQAPVRRDVVAAESGADEVAELAELTETADDVVVAEAAPFDVAAHTAEVAVAPEPVVAEVAPVAVVESSAPAVDEDDMPLTWDPVPVPRPTYTMKAKAAERPVATAEVTPVPVDDDTAYDDDVPERWIVGG
ncbi:hypothetical protein [Knoellia subterranea]|uniref:Uncharacterized protein n=1 Tax=Knoellia subterranea KCTC 19937 TaxID=1385521 RepID=A0A0A0JLP8_9MICO|nr:hypothetical protein [Knoellia subterranea]KGN36541.1 hypothetical protein N803_04635 [Knoellia subterranea KCTC 19937]